MNDTDCNLVIKKNFFGNSLLTSSLSFNSNSDGNLSPLNNPCLQEYADVAICSTPIELFELY